MNKPTKPAAERRTRATSATQVYYHRNQAVAIPNGFIAIGRVSTAHALRGEVRVELHTDFPERFIPGLVVYLGESLSEATVDYTRPHKQQLLVKFIGVETRNEAEALRGQWLFVPEDTAVELEDDTFWIHDIIGIEVQTEEGDVLGRISDVLATGANDVYVIQRKTDGGELLLPAIADVVQQIDLAANRMTVRLLPGLIDE